MAGLAADLELGFFPSVPALLFDDVGGRRLGGIGRGLFAFGQLGLQALVLFLQPGIFLFQLGVLFLKALDLLLERVVLLLQLSQALFGGE
jgi:hypothetical protein